MKNLDLLKPSLSSKRKPRAIYSVGALIAAAFFGGALAVPIIAFANSRRQNRLARDAIWILLGVVFAAVVLFLAMAQSELLDSRESRRAVKSWATAGGFALVPVYYLLHRRIYKTQQAVGIKPPKPYKLVIAAILLAVGVNAWTILVLVHFLQVTSL